MVFTRWNHRPNLGDPGEKHLVHLRQSPGNQAAWFRKQALGWALHMSESHLENRHLTYLEAGLHPQVANDNCLESSLFRYLLSSFRIIYVIFAYVLLLQLLLQLLHPFAVESRRAPLSFLSFCPPPSVSVCLSLSLSLSLFTLFSLCQRLLEPQLLMVSMNKHDRLSSN